MNSCAESGVAKFSTYAYYYVLGEVTRYLREDRTIKVSRDLIKLNQSIEKTRELLRQRLLREPTDLEISLFLEVDEEKIVMARNALMFTKSLDEMVDDEERLNYYNSIQTYDRGMDSSIMDLNGALEKLSDEDRKIIYDHYYNGYTQSEISKSMGISQVQVSRREGKILEKLKARL